MSSRPQAESSPKKHGRCDTESARSRLPAEEAPGYPAPLAQLRQDPLSQIDRDSEANPLATWHDGSVNADYFTAQVEQWPAAIAWVNRCIGLDKIIVGAGTNDLGIKLLHVKKGNLNIGRIFSNMVISDNVASLIKKRIRSPGYSCGPHAVAGCRRGNVRRTRQGTWVCRMDQETEGCEGRDGGLL
jgi:hypothetical protein